MRTSRPVAHAHFQKVICCCVFSFYMCSLQASSKLTGKHWLPPDMDTARGRVNSQVRILTRKGLGQVTLPSLCGELRPQERKGL